MTPPSTFLGHSFNATTEQHSGKTSEPGAFDPPTQLQPNDRRDGAGQNTHSVDLRFGLDRENNSGHHNSQTNSHISGFLNSDHNGLQPITYHTEPMWHEYNLSQDLGGGDHHALSLDNILTPEYSENHVSDHTTPQEQIWEQQFLSTADKEPHIVDEFHHGKLSSPGFLPSLLNGLRGVSPEGSRKQPEYVTGSQLLSPQPTTPSPSVHKARVSAAQQGTAAQAPLNMDGAAQNRPAAKLSVATNQDIASQLPHARQHSRSSPQHRSVSPVVIVSSHGNENPHLLHDFSRRRSLSASRPRDHSPDVTVQQHHDSSKRLMPPDMFQIETAEDDQEQRTGLDPSQRDIEQVASVNELAEKRLLDERNAEVQDWLSKSETGSTGDDSSITRRRRQVDRPRAHSTNTGVKLDAMGLPIYSDEGIPGPGVLLNEDSEDEYSDAESDGVASSEASEIPTSPPVTQEKLQSAADDALFPNFEDDNIPPEMQEPLPRQFYRRTPWQDPARAPISDSTRDQPASSNAAIVRFNQEAAKWETASRAATWGTRRRLSESEVNSIVDGSKVRHLSLAKRGRERGNTLLNKARGLIPRRNSNIKKQEESSSQSHSPHTESPPHKESSDSTKALQRMGSFGKPKSPPLNTSNALLAMTGNLAAVGHVVPFSAEPDMIKSEGLKSPLQVLRKVRSKSDAGRSPKASSGLAGLMSRYGGPPVPTLASPHKEPDQFTIQAKTDRDQLDDEDDDLLDDTGIKMDLRIRAEDIIPSYEGFKMHARRLNPRLEPYLIDRIGQEQVRRYKKLLDTKIKHLRAVKIQQKCPSGKYCIDLGGSGELLTPRPSNKDPETACAQFQIEDPEDGEMEEDLNDEGVVTRAQFPPGIPIPPVKRLPAEFECMLCFKVKKFYKPSDWTKHVHEDIQPFSCTFPHCNEPKSFKRKADWVRHENERHRRLEYWRCSVQECNHMCYRKDNFVQHLVREHKKAEPKAKSRGSGSSKARPAQGNPWQDDDEVWRLVESCRFETAQKPRMEPCKFCGNVCSSWKKLSVHMGKHMEQVALPILELVQMREVAPDTVISPIEQNYNQQPNLVAAMQPPMVPTIDHASLSPYAMSAHSAHHSSSGGQSPASIHMPAHSQMAYEGSYYGTHGITGHMQDQFSQSEEYSAPAVYSNSAGYSTTGMPVHDHYNAINTQLAPVYNSTQYIQTPVSAQSMPRSSPADMYNGSAHEESFNTAQYSYNTTNDMSAYPQYSSAAAAQVHQYGELPHQHSSNPNFVQPSHGTGNYGYSEQRFGDQPPGY